MAKKVNGQITEKYLWANLTTLLAVYDGNDSLVTRFEYADNRMPYKMTHNGQTYYLSYDQVGTLKAVTDENGTIVKTIEYDSFGNVLSDSNESLRMPFGFAGGLYDSDTGLTRFGYRDYDAETGKWTAKDPIGFNGGDANLYGYVLGDPVDFVDPEGLKPAWKTLWDWLTGSSGTRKQIFDNAYIVALRLGYSDPCTEAYREASAWCYQNEKPDAAAECVAEMGQYLKTCGRTDQCSTIQSNIIY